MLIGSRNSVKFFRCETQFIINAHPATYLSLMVTTFENSCFTHTRNQMHEVLSKPMGKMTATHISPNTRTGKKSSLSNSDFNDSSQNNSISKAHTSGSNVVLASPSQPTAYRPNSFQRHSHSWGKNSFNVALNQTRY